MSGCQVTTTAHTPSRCIDAGSIAGPASVTMRPSPRNIARVRVRHERRFLQHGDLIVAARTTTSKSPTRPVRSEIARMHTEQSFEFGVVGDEILFQPRQWSAQG